MDRCIIDGGAMDCTNEWEAIQCISSIQHESCSTQTESLSWKVKGGEVKGVTEEDTLGAEYCTADTRHITNNVGHTILQ